MKQTTGVYAVLTAALFLGSMAGVGCGGDDDTTGSGGSGGSGGSAATGGSGGGKGGSGGSGGATGGTGGTAGADAGGKGGTAGADAGSDGPVTMTCGTRICAPIITMVGLTLPACCPMGEMNACGGTVAQAGGACITATPGTPDSSCPAITGQAIPLPGCCRPNGLCGINFSILGLGCTDPTPLGGNGMQACGGDGGMPPADTGTPDMGGGDTGGGDTGTGDTGGGDTGTGDTGGGDTSDTGTGDTGTGDGRGDTGDSAPPSDAPAG